jgi:hypothetical protein
MQHHSVRFTLLSGSWGKCSDYFGITNNFRILTCFSDRGDPSIATAVLRANPNTVLSDFELFGFLFESLCTRDMRVYAQANDGDLFH